MELRDFDIENLINEKVVIEGIKYRIQLWLTRTNFMPLYYNDFKKYPSKKFPIFVLCYKTDSKKRIALFKTEEDGKKFFEELISKSKEYTKEEFDAFVRNHMLINRQLRYKYGRF